jgi:iron complex outermembrane receptor protein
MGKQYKDNTSNDNNAIADFFVNDIRLRYTTSFKYLKNIGATLLVNNIFGTLYGSSSSNYNYVEKGFLVNKDYYFPQQIQRNFLLSLNVKF